MKQIHQFTQNDLSNLERFQQLLNKYVFEIYELSYKEDMDKVYFMWKINNGYDYSFFENKTFYTPLNKIIFGSGYRIYRDMIIEKIC